MKVRGLAASLPLICAPDLSMPKSMLRPIIIFILFEWCWTGGAASAQISRWAERDVVIPVPSGLVVGTLNDGGSEAGPLVVIVSGSGPVDRDGATIRSYSRPYRDVARYFAANGISSFRYDKPGIGASLPTNRYGSHSTLSVQIDDFAEVVHFLKSNFPGRPIIAFAHSEGTLVVLPQSANLVDGLVLASPPGTSMREVFLYQIGNATSDPTLVELTNEYVDSLIKGRNVQPVPALYTYFDPTAQDYMKEILRIDLSAELARQKSPTTILRGRRDSLVDFHDVMAFASANPAAHLIIAPEADHMLYEPGGQISNQTIVAIRDVTAQLH